MKSAYIATFGCQMNEHDSEQMAGALSAMGYLTTEDPEAADLVLVNTCSIRHKAEEKAYSLLGRLRRYKVNRPHLMLIVAGCLAQQEGERLFRRVPHADLVVGPRGIHLLPELVRKAGQTKRKIAYTNLAAPFSCPSHPPDGRSKLKAYVSIMTGCNNFCSYCIVPYVRGRESSRRSEDILSEVRSLVAQGVKEITLLGQNVNSYGLTSKDECSFATLIKRIDEIEGLERLRFTTSHPKDLSEELVKCFGTARSLCEHIHLPVQSGSNRILRRMNRKYTRDDYLQKVASLKKACPAITLTTDLIVGFPGESDADFEDTLDMMKQVGFSGAFVFRYSDRAPAKAALCEDKLPEPAKQERLSAVLAVQKELAYTRHKSMINKAVDVLVEGHSKNSPDEWTGRTRTNEVVNFSGGSNVFGKLVSVDIERACLHSLKGSLAGDGIDRGR